MPKLWFDIKTNRIIRVSLCKSGKGGYTFYKTRNLAKQGTRVRMRPAKWFSNRGDAERALQNYCRLKPQYKRFSFQEILQRLEKLKPKQFNPIFRKWI